MNELQSETDYMLFLFRIFHSISHIKTHFPIKNKGKKEKHPKSNGVYVP